MVLSILLYNLLLALVDAAALGFVCRTRSFRSCFLAALGTGIAAAVMALPLAGNVFGLANLAAYALFLHGTILLLGAALLLKDARRKTAVAFVIGALVLVGVLIDAALIEPEWLEVSHRQIVSAKIHRSLRIVVLADLQTDHFGEYEKNVFRRALAEQPDLLLLAGDYFQASRDCELELRSQFSGFLRTLDLPPPGRVFAIQGNMDGADWPEIFSGLPVTTVGLTESFSVAGIQLTCLGLGDSGRPSLSLDSPDPRQFHLVLGHRPDFARGPIAADLLVAGHTHGGQVRLPGIGPLMTLSSVPRRWAAGLTELPGGKTLIVSRGVGMERGLAPRLRFLCRPELVVVDLVPDGSVAP